MTGSLDGVRAVARDKNMNLLIDTYASWCIPCKRMDKIFDQKDVGDFFNDNYLTYRVNMDGPYGDAVKAEYQVVFLPTIIIIGPEGEVKYKVDREMTAEELISIGELALQPGIKIASDATGFRKNGELQPEGQVYTMAGSPAETAKAKKQAAPKPVKKSKQKKEVAAVAPVDEGKIVHVLAKGEVPPPILRQEAYSRLELMDGSHKAAAAKYLATQSNWDTEENMRFILDFVHTTDSREYQHIIQHKAKYEDFFSKKTVDNTLQILAYRRLYKGIPRPDKDEVQQLYTELGYPNPRTMCYTYFINRYKAEEAHDKVYETYMYYHKKVVVLDTAALENFTEYLSDYKAAYTHSQLEATAALIAQKSTIAGNLSLTALQARVLVLAGQCKKAKRLIKKATKAARKQEKDTTVLEQVAIVCDA